jgi:putative nucleotidyltransferase with HDIG domain
MIKKISIHQLAPDMYIHDLNCSWVVHPLFPHRFKVMDEAKVEEIHALGVRELYIDTRRGKGIADAPDAQEVKEAVEQELLDMAAVLPAGTEPRVSLREEAPSAAKIHEEAAQAVHRLMGDIRLGEQCALEDLDASVDAMADSVLRNSNALNGLGLIKTKDGYTFLHSVSVGALLATFCNALSLGKDIARQATFGGLLHDIGKMRVPDNILNNPGRLSTEQFDIMKEHVQHGQNVLQHIDGMSQSALDISLHHHERFDGSGYPGALKGGEISPFGQMAAIVDVYDAITSARVYHEPINPAEAIRKIQEWSKFHFNEELVRHFIRCIGIYPIGSLVSLESGLIGVVVEHNAHNTLRPVIWIAYDTRTESEVIPPYDLDISQPLGHGGGDRIVDYEAADKWGIRARRSAFDEQYP